MTEIINISNLKFAYNNTQQILKDINLSINEGEIFALLGHNGAGKTTLIRILLNFIRNYEGEVKLFGFDVSNINARKRIGYMSEHPITYEYETADGYLRYFASLADMKTDINEKINELLELTGLIVHKHKKLSEYSKGMLQRLNLSRALLNDPDLLIMDEPIIGLDPIGQQLIEDVVKNRKQAGKAVLVNTHAVEFAEKVADRVAFIMGGELKTVLKREDFEKTEFPLNITLEGGKESLQSLQKEYTNNIVNKEQNFITVNIANREEYFKLLKKTEGLKLLINKVNSTKVSLSQKFLDYAKYLAREEKTQ